MDRRLIKPLLQSPLSPACHLCCLSHDPHEILDKHSWEGSNVHLRAGASSSGTSPRLPYIAIRGLRRALEQRLQVPGQTLSPCSPSSEEGVYEYEYIGIPPASPTYPAFSPDAPPVPPSLPT